MVSVVPWPRCFCLATARCSWLPEKEGNKHTMPALFPRLTNRTSQPAWNLERGKESEALQLAKRHARQAQSLRNVSEERTALETGPSVAQKDHLPTRARQEISKRPRRSTGELGPGSKLLTRFTKQIQHRSTINSESQPDSTQTSKSNPIALSCF